MTDLLTLSRRVSEAEGPSRELDLQVSAALFWKPGWIDSVRTAMAPAGTVWFTAGNCDQAMALHCDWTASLDAVAALIAEKLPPTWAWTLGKNLHHQTWGASVNNLNDEGAPYSVSWGGYSQSPALALLSAALLAIHERNKSDE